MAIGESVGIELSRQVMQLVVPKGVAWVSTQFKGEIILLVGPPNSGKTCFYEYLVSGTLSDPATIATTTGEIVESLSFGIKVSESERMQISVKKLIDIPGQGGATGHAKLAFSIKPTVIFVLLDSSAPLQESRQWFSEFIEEFSDFCREEKGLLRRLKVMSVILNKKDVTPDELRERLRKSISSAVKKHLHPLIGNRRCKDIPVMSAVLVENPDGALMINKVLKNMAIRILRK